MRQSKGGCDAQGKAPAGGNQTTEFEYRERERDRDRDRESTLLAEPHTTMHKKTLLRVNFKQVETNNILEIQNAKVPRNYQLSNYNILKKQQSF